jgi:hypothetical protein
MAMLVLVNVLCFILGVVSTVLVLMTVALRLKAEAKTPASPKTTASSLIDKQKAASILERLKEADEISIKQNKIDTRQGPDFVMQYNELNLQKLSLLKRIIADGFDPVVTIRYNSSNEEMLLSTYVETIKKGLA